MWQRQTLDITTPAGKTIQHGLLAHDPPGDLLVMLPGRNYTCRHAPAALSAQGRRRSRL